MNPTLFKILFAIAVFLYCVVLPLFLGHLDSREFRLWYSNRKARRKRAKNSKL